MSETLFAKGKLYQLITKNRKIWYTVFETVGDNIHDSVGNERLVHRDVVIALEDSQQTRTHTTVVKVFVVKSGAVGYVIQPTITIYDAFRFEEVTSP